MSWAVGGRLRVAMVPYVRMTTGGKWSARARRYTQAQGWIGADVVATMRRSDRWKGRGGGSPLIKEPIRVGLRITQPPTKAGKLPMNRGDYDNFLKAFLDAIVGAGVIADDSMRWYRGPALMMDGKMGGVEVGEVGKDREVEWVICGLEEEAR